MAVFNSNVLAGASGQTPGAAASFQVERSLRFNNDDSAHLNRTPSTAGNSKTWTWSGWVKRGGTGFHTDFFSAVQSGSNATIIQFDNNDRLDFENFVGNSDKGRKITNEFFKDTNGWYHIVVAYDSTNSTADDRVKIYVNGKQITSFNYSTNPDSGQNTIINSTYPHYLGVDKGFSNHYFDGYLAEVNFVDGRQLAAADFGEYDDNNVWQPKEFTSFDNPNNGTTWSDAVPTADGFRPGRAAEDGFDGDLSTYVALDNTTFDLDVGSWNLTGTVEVYTGSNMQYAVDGGSASSMTADGWTNVGDAGSIDTLTFTRTDGNYPYFYAIRVGGYVLIDDSVDNSFRLDFSDNSSSTTLGNDKAVSEPSLNPRGGFGVVTYSGTGSTQQIDGLSFQPDMIWCKTRDHAVDHKLTDNVRGFTKILGPNVAQVEETQSNGLTGTTPKGFSVGSSNDYNHSSRTYVAWCWKAGGLPVANTTGTIDSQVSASTNYGFSVVSYTGNNTAGATVGHGLGSVPKFILIKDRESTSGWWAVYHASQGNTKGAYLNDDQGFGTQSFWNDTTPTSSVFSLGANANTNANGNDMMAYCWAEKSGFSKFGSYTGTGAAGVSVTTGFQPAWVLIKEASQDQHWFIYDVRRGSTKILWASSSAYESQIGEGDGSNQNAIQIDSNGFTIPHTLSGTNRNGSTYVYAAFADRPGNNFNSNNLVAKGAAKTLTRFRTRTDWNYHRVAAVKINGTILTTGTLDNTGSVWTNPDEWKDGNADSSNITYSQAARGDWFDVTLADEIPNFNELQMFIQLDASSGTTTNTYEIELFFSDGTSYLKTYASNGAAPNQSNYAFNSYQWQNFGNLGLGEPSDSDSLIDSPMNYEVDSGNNGGNYATWTPMVAQTSGSIELSNGNLDTTCGTTRTTAMSTWPLTGKTYWEITFKSGTYNYIGMTQDTGFRTVANDNSGIKYTGYKDYSYGWGQGDGKLYNTSNIIGSPGTYNNGDVVGWAYDADNNTLKLYKNGTLQHTETDITDAQYFPALTHSGTATASTNFGQFPFAYTPPTDHVSLCSQNFDATIADGSTAMATSLYTGNGNSGQTVSGLKFSPDFVWFKGRSETRNHAVFDSVRGVEKRLQPNKTQIEDDSSSGLTAFNSDGFTFGANNSNGRNGTTYVAWAWDAGTSTASNSDGSLTANVRANPSTGFSIIQFSGNASSGATVGHGLNAAPELIIGKNRGGTDNWWVWFKAISSNASEFLRLNLTNTTSDTQYIANDTAPSSSVITLGSDYGWNSSQSPGSILYAFTPIPGYSAFGEYTGSSNKFVYTGFKPQWLLLKSYAGDGFNWVIIDDERGADSSNVSNKLYPNKDSGEDDDSRSSETKVVFLSNGFTFLDQGAETNSGSRSYAFAAFASHPLKYSRAGF